MNAEEETQQNNIQMQTPPKKFEFKLTTPIAIIIAGLIIGSAVILGTAKKTSPSPEAPQRAIAEQPNQNELLANVLPVSDQDHVKGSDNPKVTIIEYSDYECPFCKRFHFIMNDVIAKYSDDVAWVYRHFPLDSIHPEKARKEAMAAECAADQLGTDGFWAFSDKFFEMTPSNNQTDLDRVLPQIASEIGLEPTEFENCIASQKFADKIDRDLQNAIDTGGRGTPWSIIIGENGEKMVINGAQPVQVVSQLIETLLNN